MAPPHTEVESMELYNKTLATHVAAGKELIIVDGQPRTPKQLKHLVYESPYNTYILHVYADEQTRRARLEVRNGKGNILNEGRLKNDLPMLYELLTYGMCHYPLLFDSERYFVVDTSDSTFNVATYCKRLHNALI